MHKSRLSTFVIDCQGSDLEQATRFWSQALGRPAKTPMAGSAKYRDLECAASEPLLMIQQVDHESRIHLDIESDDIEAEVTRLELLGAKRIEKVSTWVVMQAPTGQRFCVVRPQRGDLGLNATSWPSNAALTFAKESDQHYQLRALHGRYTGEVKTWLEPSHPPEKTLAELRVETLLGGRWTRFAQQGTTAGQAHSGEMLLGYHNDIAKFEHCWIDSFHTGTAMMISTGEKRTDGVIAVTGSYRAGPQTWGWRTEFHLNPFITRCFNISPEGEEYPAIETVWTRL